MDRDSLNEILNAAKEDKFDILMIWSIDRLTRAELWETLIFILELRKQEIIIYSHQDGYFDWEDANDGRRMVNRIINARAQRDAIVNGAADQNKIALENGHWPNGPLGYGLVDLDEEGLVIKSDYEWVIKLAFDLISDGNSVGEAKKIISSRVENCSSDIDTPSKYQLKRLLQNELYIGRLTERKTDEFVRVWDKIDIIDHEIFNQVQEILSESDSDDGPLIAPQDFPPFIYELILRLGQEYIVENISGICWCCPKCRSTDIRISDTLVDKWGFSIPHIYCNKDDCYNGPVIRLKDLENIDSTLPLVCPECQKTGDFSVESVSDSHFDDAFKYMCNFCGGELILDKNPNPYKRALESSNAIDLRDSDTFEIDREAELVKAEEKSDQQNAATNSESVTISNKDIFEALESWLTENGPQTEKGRQILLEAMKILDKEGPLKKNELLATLSSTISHSYSSPGSLWESNIARFLEEIPGLMNPSHGRYEFRREQITHFLEWQSNDRGH
jgi:DNA invertase Pin-like site-specific DNA recombinase